MKYNPRINEQIASLPGFSESHPLAKIESVQGNLEVLYNLQDALKAITGLDAVTLQPAAGAHGELTGLLIVKSFFKDKKEDRNIILTPDSSHGTNPASANMCGFKVQTIKSDKNGQTDLDSLKQSLTKKVAAIMLTVPNTLGIFEKDIREISKLCHENGSLVYMDGANLNAILGKVYPKDMGIDIMHINAHKTFSTPHGGGGPGAGPVAVSRRFEPYLPVPRIEKIDNKFTLSFNKPKSIGKLTAFYGNFGVLLRAYSYILSCGKDLKKIAEHAVLNANYLKEKLKRHFSLPYDVICMHEFILDDHNLPNQVTTMDVAKRLIDYGFHPPTIYFPLIVHGAIMIEPTETENKETLDSFFNALIHILEEAKKNPDLVKKAPYSTPIGKLNEVKAARHPVLSCCD